MMIVGLMSTYREGRLARLAAESAARACDAVIVYEGPIGDAPETGEPSSFSRAEPPKKLVVRVGTWADDAAKRTGLIRHAQEIFPKALWGLWIDGDEVIMNGEFLADLLAGKMARTAALDRQPDFNFPLRIVEMDGSVGVAHGRCFRVDLVERMVLSSYQFMLKGIETVATLPNEPQRLSAWRDAREPYRARGQMYLDPPLPGEPFILHRSPLRDPARSVQRQHEAEGDWWLRRP